MKIPIIALFSLVVGIFLASCNVAGPIYPEQNGRTYLEELGYPEDLISRLIEGKKLAPSEVQDLQESKSSDVRFLVARNPSLSQEQIAVSITHNDDLTRSGAAKNTNLSEAQIELLTEDESHVVYSALAGNTSLTDKQILSIREKRDLGDLWFAMNPNCPMPIRESIVASDDSLAKSWLEITDGRKEDGYYLQDDGGRWYKP